MAMARREGGCRGTACAHGPSPAQGGGLSRLVLSMGKHGGCVLSTGEGDQDTQGW